MLWLLACFGRTPNSWNGCISDSFACSWDPFSPTGLPHPVLMCPVWLITLGGLVCSGGAGMDMGERGGGGELGGVKGTESLVGKYGMRE